MEKIFTLDQLKRKGVPLRNRCYRYKREEESFDHILLHCALVSMLRQLIFSIFGVAWVIQSSTRLMMCKVRICLMLGRGGRGGRGSGGLPI